MCSFFVEFGAQGTSCRVDDCEDLAPYISRFSKDSPNIETAGLDSPLELYKPDDCRKRTEGGVNTVALKKACFDNDVSHFLAVFRVITVRINLLNIEYKI